MSSLHQRIESADITMEQDSSRPANGDLTISTFDSDTTEATTAMDASPFSKRTRQPSEEQELGSLVGSSSLPSLTSSAGAITASSLPPAPSTTTDIILEDVNEEEAQELSDSEWDVVDKMESEGATRPIPSSRNGEGGPSLWARGFKDKYKLALVLPRGPSSPLRPPISRNGSRRGSSQAGSVRSSNSRNPSPPTTPEPRQSPMRRLASMRSSSSNNVPKAHPRYRQPQRSTIDDSAENEVLAEDATPLASSISMSALETPRKAGQAIKRLTLSAFRPSRSPSQSS